MLILSLSSSWNLFDFFFGDGPFFPYPSVLVPKLLCGVSCQFPIGVCVRVPVDRPKLFTSDLVFRPVRCVSGLPLNLLISRISSKLKTFELEGLFILLPSPKTCAQFRSSSAFSRVVVFHPPHLDIPEDDTVQYLMNTFEKKESEGALFFNR